MQLLVLDHHRARLVSDYVCLLRRFRSTLSSWIGTDRTGEGVYKLRILFGYQDISCLGVSKKMFCY